MPLVEVLGGMSRDLTTLINSWAGQRFAGLFQNDVEPRRDWTISNVVPANFSGYAGLQLLTGWTTPVRIGNRFQTRAAGVTWTHNGGPNQNWIFGYYVVTAAGVLVWAERRPGPAVALNVSGIVYDVVAGYTFGSKFPRGGV